MGIPYTYLIGWSEHRKYYYGVRFAQNSHPRDLWKTYFTSSKYVEGMRKSHGEPDIIEVRKIFDDATKARLWENKVLRRLNVTSDKKWLNQTMNMSRPPNTKPWSEERRKRTIESMKRAWAKPELRKQASESHKGLVKSESHCRALSKALKGRSAPWAEGKRSPEFCLKLSGANSGRAIPVELDGVKYPTISEYCARNNVSYYLAKQRINMNNLKETC